MKSQLNTRVNVELLKQDIDKGELGGLAKADVIEVSEIIKLFLRKLPGNHNYHIDNQLIFKIEPLLTSKLYKRLISIGGKMTKSIDDVFLKFFL